MKKTSAALLACLLFAACPEKGPADFRKLAEEAYPKDGKENKPGLERLWIELNKLPQWHFTSTKDLAGQKQPSIELIEGKSYLVAFTDLQMAQAYARSKAAPATPPAAAAPGTQLGDSPFAVNAPPAAEATVDAGDSAKPNPYLDDKGGPVVVAMSPDEAVAYLEKYQGPPLAGIRFNEGARRAWFGDVAAVIGIRKGLKKNGSL